MSQLTPEQYQEKLSKLQFANPTARIWTGFFLNHFDNVFVPALMAQIAFTAPGPLAPKITMGVMAATMIGAQVFLATKGYTPSKLLCGRKVIDTNTLEKASVVSILLRPLVATFWMYAMIGVLFMATFLGGMISSLFHVKENDKYDAAYNNALTASMAGASGGFVLKFISKYPRIVWLHDTLFKTTVISIPYKEIIAELKGEKPKKQIKQVEEVQSKKAA